ncbi:Hypothetical protein R9X50_00489000 [Acrodontium crateriforme]|uniref:Actin-related protein 8 n=1 Tax=Acrodontium crateriforme TaxID=150365 RepID=A0AAQ3M653_9PEZI|nr:Hypothetical protein R9X50_00489000 [Acrodontium crateriforme]
MVGKKSGRALLRDEGLQRTDNNMEFTSWPQVNMINQKNYYTEFLKRDDQTLALRLQHDEQLDRRKKAAVDIDRARAQAAQDGLPFTEPAPAADEDNDDDEDMEDADSESFGSKTIVIHVGSQNLRLGFATDALPKTVPMVIARKSKQSEAEDSEPRPKRMKLDVAPEEWFGEEFAKEYTSMASDFKISRRANKRRVLPNSRELVTKWNTQNTPEFISEHNDPLRIEWTETSEALDYIVGEAALRIPDDSKPRYRLHWPIRHGWLNEEDYTSRHALERDFFLIIEESIRSELGLKHKKEWNQYSCVFLIPDIYEKVLVGRVLEELFLDFGFQKVCFMQESLAASFGAGFSTACIVDIGAQKTSVCCVEDGMCIEDSRINMKYGGYDVTETFVKMMLFDHFNYDEFNLARRHDFLLAEDLKDKHTTLSDENVTVQLYDFHVRASGQETRKYQFKIYDEGQLAPLGYFRPAIFEHSEKVNGRRKLIPRSVDLYSGHPNDPLPLAQMAVIAYVDRNVPSAVMAPPAKPARLLGTPTVSTPSKPRPLGLPGHLNGGDDGTPRSSVAGSPPPEDIGNGTPQPNGEGGANGEDSADIHGAQPDVEVIDRTVPLMPLDQAILTSIHHACTTSSNAAAPINESRRRDLLGAILVIGGASKTPYLREYLEQRLRASMPQYPKEILVAGPPRELDPEVLVWKGGSVFGKLRMTNDSWIGALEYDRLGTRILHYKCMWHW